MRARRWPAPHGGDGVDRAHFGEAFAVALLAFRQAGLQLGGGCRGRLVGGWAQGVGSHDDAFAVGRDHHHVGVVGAGAFDAGVEGLDVGGRAGR